MWCSPLISIGSLSSSVLFGAVPLLSLLRLRHALGSQGHDQSKYRQSCGCKYQRWVEGDAQCGVERVGTRAGHGQCDTDGHENQVVFAAAVSYPEFGAVDEKDGHEHRCCNGYST